MSQDKNTAPAPKNDLHAPLRPLGLKAVAAAAMMLQRNTKCR